MVTGAWLSLLLQSGPVTQLVVQPSTPWLAKRKRRGKRVRKKAKRVAPKAVAKPAAKSKVPSAPVSLDTRQAKAQPWRARDERPGIAALDLVAVKGVDEASARILNEDFESPEGIRSFQCDHRQFGHRRYVEHGAAKASPRLR